MDSSSTIHGIPQWEHPKQIGCGEKLVDIAPPFSPRRPGTILSQLLPPRTPTSFSASSQSITSRSNVPPATQQHSSPEQSKRSPPNTSMDHRALLKMDGVTPDKMLIAFDSDSHSCCPSVGDITWDHSEAMAFQQSSMDQRSLKSQQHPWQNFTEIQTSSTQVIAKDRPLSVTKARPKQPTDPLSSPRKSRNQLTSYGKTGAPTDSQKHRSSDKLSTDRASRSRTPTPVRSNNGSHEALNAMADITSPPKMPSVRSSIRKKSEQNEIDLSFNFGSGSPSQKCPEEVNLAALFSRKKELNRNGNSSKGQNPVAGGGIDAVTPSISTRPKSGTRDNSRSSLSEGIEVIIPAPPSLSRPKSRTRVNASSQHTLPLQEQFWPGIHGPSKIESAATRNVRTKQPSIQEIRDATSTKCADIGSAAEMNRLHFEDRGINETSWKKLNCSKSSLHSTSKHIDESIQSLETTLFGSCMKKGASRIAESNDVKKDNNNAVDDDGDDYDVVNEIVDDYIDFDTALAMTSAIMED